MDNKIIKNESHINRLITVGRELWNQLTDDERETWANDTGTMGFVEHVQEILHIDLNDVDEFEQVHELIINPPTVVEDLRVTLVRHIDHVLAHGIEPIQLTEAIQYLAYHLTEEFDEYHQDGNIVYHVINGRIDILDMTDPRPKFLGSLTISD